MSHDVKVGDVFVSRWGYDQTNVECYAVVRVTAASVAVKPCGAKAVGEGHSTRIVPDPSTLMEWRSNWCPQGKPNTSGEIIKRVGTSGSDGRPYLRMTDYEYAYLWDGERSYFDTIAAGYPGH